jgi:hypothetical protein
MFIRTKEAQKAVEGKQGREFTGNIAGPNIAFSLTCHTYATMTTAIGAGQPVHRACTSPGKAVK